MCYVQIVPIKNVTSSKFFILIKLHLLILLVDIKLEIRILNV